MKGLQQALLAGKRGAPVVSAGGPAARQIRQRCLIRTRAGLDKGKINKVVLAYSGGLDTSVILKWLQETYDCEVVTFTADLGQVGHTCLCEGGILTGRPLLHANRSRGWP